MAKPFKDMEEFLDLDRWIKDCIFNFRWDELRIILENLELLNK